MNGIVKQKRFVRETINFWLARIQKFLQASKAKEFLFNDKKHLKWMELLKQSDLFPN